MKKYSISYITIFTISLLILSCNRQVKDNIDTADQTTSTPIIEAPYVDQLFFIDGQLCQHLRKIFQDSKGNLWMGTNIYGMMMYDGKELKYFDEKDGIGGGRITGIVEDKNGNVWFSSYEGLTKYDGNSFINYTQPGKTDNELWCLLLDSKGVFWVGTNYGVSKFDGKEFTAMLIPKKAVQDTVSMMSQDRISSIAEDKNGNMWFGTDGFGICKYDGKTFTNFTTADGLCDNMIYELKADSKGDLWIGTFNGGLSKYDGKKFTNYTKEAIINGEEVSGFYEDKKGNLWFAAENNGVYKYDGNTFTNYYKNNSLPTNGILCIYEDREERFWFGGWGGLFRFDGNTFTSVTRDGPWD